MRVRVKKIKRTRRREINPRPTAFWRIPKRTTNGRPYCVFSPNRLTKMLVCRDRRPRLSVPCGNAIFVKNRWDCVSVRLPPGGRGTTQWWKEPAQLSHRTPKQTANLFVHALSLRHFLAKMTRQIVKQVQHQKMLQKAKASPSIF